MMKSYGLATVLVFVLMIIMLGSLRGGLIALIPNLIPILFTLGLMGWLGVELNMLTSLIGCIIIGVSVDNTIHFMHHFQRFARQGNLPREATRLALGHVGRALLFTSIVLCGGFLVFLFAKFSVHRMLGLLLTFSIATALIANFLVAPALLQLLWKNPEADPLRT
jgi:hypothetical protein